MYDKTKFIYVGLDLHKEQHTAVIMDCFNEKLANTVKERLISEFGDIDMQIYNCRGLCSFYAEKGGMIIGYEV